MVAYGHVSRCFCRCPVRGAVAVLSVMVRPFRAGGHACHALHVEGGVSFAAVAAWGRRARAAVDTGGCLCAEG